MPKQAIEMHAIMKGKVQGVFFRATTQKIAEEIGIVGTVRNVSDGTVEIFAQGSKEELLTLIERLKRRYSLSSEDSVEISFSEPKCAFSSFRTIYV